MHDTTEVTGNQKNLAEYLQWPSKQRFIYKVIILVQKGENNKAHRK